jgi:RNA polymerase sigma factor (sigma-70 family)
MSASSGEDDAALLTRCLRSDSDAWSLLVHRYQRLVYTIVLRFGLDEHAAADVFQTVFMRLLEHLPKISEPDRLQAWIVTTAKREALRQRDRSRRFLSMTDDDPETPRAGVRDLVDETAGAETAIEELQELNQIRDAMGLLDDRCRELLLLLFEDTDSRTPYEEVARQMGMSVGSIGPTRARCLDKLRRLVVES